MAEPLQGKNAIVEIFDVDQYYPVLCGTDLSLNVSRETIEKTGPNSDGFRERTYRLQDWNVSVSGLTRIENDSVMSWFYVLQLMNMGSTLPIRISFQDDTSTYKRITGNALIDAMGITGPATDFCNASINFLGSGPYEMDAVTPPETPELVVFSDSWETDNGADAVDLSTPSAIIGYELGTGDELLMVAVEGLQFDIITSGTPGSRECKLNTSTYVLSFGITFDGTQRVFVEFKRPV